MAEKEDNENEEINEKEKQEDVTSDKNGEDKELERL